MWQLSSLRPLRPTLRSWRPLIAVPLVILLSTVSAVLLIAA